MLMYVPTLIYILYFKYNIYYTIGMQYIPINTHTYNIHYNIITIPAEVVFSATRNNILSV